MYSLPCILLYIVRIFGAASSLQCVCSDIDLKAASDVDWSTR